jgi:hypothetical protein
MPAKIRDAGTAVTAPWSAPVSRIMSTNGKNPTQAPGFKKFQILNCV